MGLHLVATKKQRAAATATKRRLSECIKVLVKEAGAMPESRRDGHCFDYNYIHPDTRYSTLHWLSYWNDAESLETILSDIEAHKDGDEDVLGTLAATDTDKSGSFGSGDMTAITIAGERDNIKALRVYMDFFKRNTGVITKLFAHAGAQADELKLNDDQELLVKAEYWWYWNKGSGGK